MIRGPGLMGGMSGAMLLQSEQVQKELKITEAQKTKLQELSEKVRSEIRDLMSGMQNLSQEERRKKFEEMQPEMEKRAETLRKEIATILNPKQVKRWRQIELQQQGATALLRPEVADTIGLTDEQKAKLKEINDGTAEKMRKLFEERGGDRQARSAKMQQLREEGEKQAMALLKPEQKQKLGEMMGEPFKLDRSLFPSRRGGNRSGGTRQQQ